MSQQVITLNKDTAVQLLVQYVELAQGKGSYLLQESELLKRCKDFLLNKTPDAELDEQKSIQLLIQAVTKGQAKGSYTLDDASVLYKVCQYIQGQPQPQPPSQSSQSQPPPQPQSPQQSDLSRLSEPVPLKVPREV